MALVIIYALHQHCRRITTAQLGLMAWLLITCSVPLKLEWGLLGGNLSKLDEQKLNHLKNCNRNHEYKYPHICSTLCEDIFKLNSSRALTAML